jgi:energy-coupling factor transport system substrate-specific component
MSWQLASFAIVLVALAIAFWWYERSQPTPKLLALLATLAAIAALGRDAFAAIPDVKPITTIVLISGIAFGAGPGFAVGAIAALASNFLLGQGPWTPWQMVGWGLVGLLGAVIGRVDPRRLGPIALALACGVAAEVFNLVVNLYTWTGTGDHTLRAFGIVLGSAVVFDVTHVVASFGFGLVFGPTLLRMLMRVRSRLDVSWRVPSEHLGRGAAHGVAASTPIGLPLLLLALAVAVLVGGRTRSAHATSAPIAARVGVAREVAYLAKAQNADGGFGGTTGQSSSELFSSWAALGLAAAERNPLSVRKGGHTVLDAIRAQAGSLHGAGDIERTILALHACGVSVRSLPGGDPVRRLLRFRARDGSFGGLTNLTAFAILALRAAGYSTHDRVVRGAASWLARQQEADGGFGFAKRGGGSDIDDTAAALQALVAAGARGKTTAAHAVAFIFGAQNLDGGFPQQTGGESNAQSTAWAVQALDAASRNVEAVTRQGSRSPLGYLRSLVASDGSVRYSRTGAQTPVWVTAQALTALAGKPLPIAPVRRTANSSQGAEAASLNVLGHGLERAIAVIGQAIHAILAPAPG